MRNESGRHVRLLTRLKSPLSITRLRVVIVSSAFRLYIDFVTQFDRRQTCSSQMFTFASKQSQMFAAGACMRFGLVSSLKSSHERSH